MVLVLWPTSFDRASDLSVVLFRAVILVSLWPPPQHKMIGKTERKYLSRTPTTNYPILTVSSTRFVTTKVSTMGAVPRTHLQFQAF